MIFLVQFKIVYKFFLIFWHLLSSLQSRFSHVKSESFQRSFAKKAKKIKGQPQKVGQSITISSWGQNEPSLRHKNNTNPIFALHSIKSGLTQWMKLVYCLNDLEKNINGNFAALTPFHFTFKVLLKWRKYNISTDLSFFSLSLSSFLYCIRHQQREN